MNHFTECVKQILNSVDKYKDLRLSRAQMNKRERAIKDIFQKLEVRSQYVWRKEETRHNEEIRNQLIHVGLSCHAWLLEDTKNTIVAKDSFHENFTTVYDSGLTQLYYVEYLRFWRSRSILFLKKKTQYVLEEENEHPWPRHRVDLRDELILSSLDIQLSDSDCIALLMFVVPKVLATLCFRYLRKDFVLLFHQYFTGHFEKGP